MRRLARALVAGSILALAWSSPSFAAPPGPEPGPEAEPEAEPAPEPTPETARIAGRLREAGG